MGISVATRQPQHSMGQRYAKHQMQQGVSLYHQRHYQRAVARWRSAVHRLRNADDKFVTLGYIAQACCDAGNYDTMLYYALQQMELANISCDDHMRAEAFLNLGQLEMAAMMGCFFAAKAYERLADFSKAIGYGRASLEHPSIDPRTPGYAHLAVALAQMGFSQFQASLEAFERAMGIASQTGDRLLELQVCVGLGALFTMLRDLHKALVFLRNALTLLTLITVENVHAKYKSAILYHLSVVLRKKGSLFDAKEACEEALRLADQTGGRSVFARSLCSLADINRELGESEAKETITKSWARYEQAFRVVRSSNDRLGEVLVLSSMAKSASESRSHYMCQCECQAIQLNTKCLELAKMLGCKYSMLKCFLRLQDLYSQLADEESEALARKSAQALVHETELFCNFCGARLGVHDEALQALRCSHIFHERCLNRFLASCASEHNCPKCSCPAVLMDDLSARASISSNPLDQQPSTSTAVQPETTRFETADDQPSTPTTPVAPSTAHISNFDGSRQVFDDDQTSDPKTSRSLAAETATIVESLLVEQEVASSPHPVDTSAATSTTPAATIVAAVADAVTSPSKPRCNDRRLPTFSPELLLELDEPHESPTARREFSQLEDLVAYVTDV